MIIKKFWQEKNKEILKQLAINIPLIYIGGFVLVQIILIFLAFGEKPLIFVWERDIAIKGFQILSIAAIALVINIFWKAWQEYGRKIND